MTSYLLKEDGDFLLQETGDKIILQEGVSASSSISPSSSVSPSVSTSPSSSISPSASPSLSPSSSLSPSISPSSSISPSVSISPSPSPSPSPGSVYYTHSDEASLPSTNADLEIAYTDDEEIIVSARDNTYVAQTGALQYMLHQFKNYVGSQTQCSIQWEGKSSRAPSSSTVYMQIYNETLSTWETIDYNSTAPADVNFEMCAKIANLTAYKDANTLISCRVYQLAL